MRKSTNLAILACSVLSAAGMGAGSASAAVLFSDNFNAGANAAWGAQRGTWAAAAGVYGTGDTNTSLSYSSVTTLPALTDFEVELDVNNIHNGGVWLRSSFSGSGVSGVLLHTGNAFTSGLYGFYWHTVVNDGVSGVLNYVPVDGLQGSDAHLRIAVAGDDYSVFLNGASSAIATFSTNMFASGMVGLYDTFAADPLQTYDNVVISDDSITPPTDGAAVPEPVTLSLLCAGFAGLAWIRRRRA